MKYIIFSFYLIIFTACTTPNKNITDTTSSKKIVKNIKYYSLEEYKYKNFSQKNDKTLKLLENEKIYDYAIEKKSILLNKTYINFYELLQDKKFFQIHQVDGQKYKDFYELIYHKNKALIYFSGENLDRGTLCVYSAYYLLTINKNKIDIMYISGGHGEIFLMPEALAKYTSEN